MLYHLISFEIILCLDLSVKQNNERDCTGTLTFEQQLDTHVDLLALQFIIFLSSAEKLFPIVIIYLYSECIFIINNRERKK